MTPRQLDLLRFICAYQDEKRHGPSFTEMAAAVGLASKSGIFRLLEGLEERGFILRRRGISRTIEILRRPDEPDTLPEAGVLPRTLSDAERRWCLTHPDQLRQAVRVAMACQKPTS